MIITCPSCNKKFEIDATLIPKKGRHLQCGSCANTWFFKYENIISENQFIEKDNTSLENEYQNEKKITNKNFKNKNFKTKKALVKYENRKKITFKNFLSYFTVFIISFIALIIILDTFKSPLINYFPELELILYNLYESIDDITLFVKDLI
tara:strand:+ start:7642 stop:8094 length:453 start_codon:yes stop_codon:yes gene_type:complete